ncbi:MAG: YicC/YloC family endoribonuclease [Tissierellia bacterium]|nr:YicC/YloC family endoribonuclease [Tissierellia bacterium]
MIKSMTGYGKYQYMDEQLTLDLEIKSVNSRYLDINIKMPNQLNYLEDKIKKIIKSFIARGRVDVFIRTQRKNLFKSNVTIDYEIAKDMKEKLSNICNYVGIEDDVKLRDILINDDIITFENTGIDEDYMLNVIETSIFEVIKKLDLMRKNEGEALYQDLDSNIQKLSAVVSEIEIYSKTIVDEQKKRLLENISKILDKNISVDEDRLANEVAFLADKADINEEITRLKSHFVQFTKAMKSLNPVGKQLDFISQEMLRETNTIGSKSSKIEITQKVIEGKSIIEKIKEQVQNVE